MPDAHAPSRQELGEQVHVIHWTEAGSVNPQEAGTGITYTQTMSIGDTYAAFQQGVVDGVILSTAAMSDYRLYEVAKHNYRLNGALIWIPNAMNPDFYDPLPDDLKEVFAVAGREAAMNNAVHYDNLTKDSLALMEEAGVTIVEPSPEDLAEIEKRLAPIWDDFVAKSENPERAQELVDRIRVLSDKYSAMTPEEIIALDKAEPVKGLLPGH